MCTIFFFSCMLTFPCPLILLISHTLFFIVIYSCVHSKTCNLYLFIFQSTHNHPSLLYTLMQKSYFVSCLGY
ncbi:hypothetical protein BDB00DRAFT_810957 [Zychaea mexicana]|uniref:uncharacterized protein n=1 Tax=Zychaea mexicana TaxID=64656 RepID=UPI0022FE2DC9|nr:uncharacterized protein BDB00DRAFT_810957 [Zychaea mexicana]KAI9495915.1 hypothetical protein BDB00DRAFT_810957 [Zychaea mexicana]